MRKLFALLLLVAVVTSAFAFANSFQVNSRDLQGQGDISSGSATVDRCINNLDVDIRGGDFNEATKDFLVGEVEVTSRVDCAFDAITVILTDKTGSTVGEITGNLDEHGNQNFDLKEKGIDVFVGEVANVHVMIQSEDSQ
ncbi:MAG: hypothetical protein KDD84_18580 [Caldilineaceae bacterium]|nr:hypothetical protein [Caldilineaceae bacterium]